MDEELKPCPFCGGEGSAYQVLDYPEKIGPRFSVICNGCGRVTHDEPESYMHEAGWARVRVWPDREYDLCEACAAKALAAVGIEVDDDA